MNEETEWRIRISAKQVKENKVNQLYKLNGSKKGISLSISRIFTGIELGKDFTFYSKNINLTK